MDWLNIHTSTMTNEAMLDASPVQVAAWLRLLHYCCAQENSGRLAGAKNWDDRKWLRTANVTKEDVAEGGRLWRWRGEDLLLEFYPLEKQNIVQKKRKFGGLGGKASGALRLASDPDASPDASRDGEADASPDASPDASRDGEADASPDASPDASRDGSTEGKGREEKGMEEEGKTRAPVGNSEPSEAPHIPTWEEFRESFLTAGIPEEWLLKQFAWYEENRAWLTPGGLLKLWKFQVRRRWASDRMSWKPAGTGSEKKSAASPAQQLFAVSRELEDLEKKLDALHERDAEIDPKDRERERELRRLKVELEQGGNSEVSGAGATASNDNTKIGTRQRSLD